ncbi:MAG: HD-like signal output (HDOD) protein, partial [Bacteroidia bacterium]
MDAEFKQFLSPDIRLPTIPGVAQQILLLANNPDSTTAELVKILSKDPAIAGTILRYVNSPTYAVPGEIDSIERAAGIMGFDNIISIALSFTLVSSPENQQRSGLDYPLLWQRSML